MGSNYGQGYGGGGKGGSKQKTENASNVKTLKVHYLYNLKRKELEKVAEL